MQVYSQSQGKLIDISDEEYAKLTSGQSSQEQSIRPGGSVREAQQSSGVVNPYGASLEDLYSGRGRALAAGDKGAASEFSQMIDLEEGYAKTITTEESATKDSEESQELITRARTFDKAISTMGYGTDEAIATGPISRRWANVQEYAGIDTRQSQLRDSLQEILMAVRKEVTGVAFSPQEQADLERLLGTLSTQEEPLARKLSDKQVQTYQQLIDRGYTEKELSQKGISRPMGFEMDERGVAERAVDVGKGAYDWMLGTGTKVAQDVGTGVGVGESGVQESQDAAIAQAEQLFNKAMETENEEDRSRMLQVAQDTFETVGQGAGEVGEMYSEDVTDPTWQRALGTGVEVAGTAALASGALSRVPGMPNAKIGTGLRGTTRGLTKLPTPKMPTASGIKDPVKKAYEKATGIFKKKPAAVGEEFLETATKMTDEGKLIRNKAIQAAQKEGRRITGNDLIDDVVKWSKRAERSNPSKKKQIKVFVDNITKRYKGKKITPDTAKELWDDASKGFTSNKQAGKTLEASYHRGLRDSIRVHLDDITGGAFEEGTGLISEGMSNQKLLKGIADSRTRSLIKEMLEQQPSQFEAFMKSGKGKILKGTLGLAAINKIFGGYLPSGAIE